MCAGLYSSPLLDMVNKSFLQKYLSPEKIGKLSDTLALCHRRQQDYGVYTSVLMEAAGFYYTENGDAAQCQKCGLEISGWTTEMRPFAIHAERSPQCPFVCSMRPDRTTTNTNDDGEIPAKRQKTERIAEIAQPNILVEVNMMRLVRRRTFSHWPHRTSPSSAQMIAAGFFSCNTGDRAICIYCNRICQQWRANGDDPFEVHRTRSPRCPYVLAQLENQQTAACHEDFVEISQRYASFATWSNENLPSVDDLVRAGFFYTGNSTIVTCFYCNGSSRNWGADDDPMIEHARWFPHCTYIKQLCALEFYQRIQDAAGHSFSLDIRNQTLRILNANLLPIHVENRLNLPMSQKLLGEGYPLSLILQCWEEQLRTKGVDFASDLDLEIACLIAQKQVQYIDDKKDNIVIPRFKMQSIHQNKPEKTWSSCWKEKREETVKRAQSFHFWLLLEPSRLLMFLAGWMLVASGETYLTECIHCGVQCDDWQPNDNPSTIHQSWSPNCPFVLSLNPIVRDQFTKRNAYDVYTPDVVAVEMAQRESKVMHNSKSPLAEPPARTKSYSRFPSELTENTIHELVKSGFYYTKTRARLQCYDCRGIVDDFHLIPIDQIDAQHLTRFPHCRLAQASRKPNELRPNHDQNLCEWCVQNPRELVVYPCNCYAVCLSCAQLTGACPRCGLRAETFYRVYV